MMWVSKQLRVFGVHVALQAPVRGHMPHRLLGSGGLVGSRGAQELGLTVMRSEV